MGLPGIDVEAPEEKNDMMAGRFEVIRELLEAYSKDDQGKIAKAQVSFTYFDFLVLIFHIFFSDCFDNEINLKQGLKRLKLYSYINQVHIKNLVIIRIKIHYCKMSKKQVKDTQICGQRFKELVAPKKPIYFQKLFNT